jgi:hypothetical protein
MSADPATARGRRPAGAVLVTALAVAVLVLGAVVQRRDGGGPATAGDGPRLALTPPVAVLTFAGPVDPADTHVWLSRGDRATAAAAVADGSTVRARLARPADGDYRMGYHVRLADGRALAGEYDFRIVGGAPDGAPRPRARPAAGHHGGDGPGAWLLAVPVLAGLAVLAAATRNRRAGRDRPRPVWTLRQAASQARKQR